MTGARPVRSPEARTPLVFFAFAHACLIAAAVLVLTSLDSFSGFYYQPRLLAVVHLTALGWVGSSILGALGSLVPRVLRVDRSPRKGDGWASTAWILGVIGLASHMAIHEPYGLISSALCAFLGGGWFVARFLRRLSEGRMPSGVRLGLRLACANYFLATGLGLLMSIDKLVDILPGDFLVPVAAHAHLAALGWAVLTALSMAEVMLPMLLPSAPLARGFTGVAVAIEVGTIGIALGIAIGTGAFPGALLAAAGVLGFLCRIAWMLGHSRRPGPRRFRPNLARAQALSAFACLAAAVAIGLALTRPGAPEESIRWAVAYGVLALLGFLGQLVAAVAGELLPTELWIRRFGAGQEPAPPPPIAWVTPLARWIAALGLAAAAPLLALGSAFDDPAAITAGAIAFLVGTLGQGASFVRLFRPPAQ